MKGRYAAVAIAIVLFSMTACFLCETDCYAVSHNGEPQEEYPDADFILTMKGGGVLLTYKIVDGNEVKWGTKEYPSNVSITVADLSSVGKDTYVVIDGASVGRLVIFDISDKGALSSFKNLKFRMVSGNIQEFNLLSVDEALIPELEKYYDLLSTPLDEVKISLESGRINLFNPTKDMIAIGNMEVHVGFGMSIDKMYATGENGKYTSASISVNGSDIGYMTNVSSKISTLEYDITSGHVRYMCIGADTQNFSYGVLSSMATSYVTGDTTVHIGDMAKIDSCIVGGGILNMPSVLSNGETVSDSMVHIITIDARSIEIVPHLAFLVDGKEYVLRFDSYSLEGKPHLEKVREECISEITDLQLYGDDGIWKSLTSSSMESGTSLYMDTSFDVQQGSTFSVKKGSQLINSNVISVKGTMIVEGDMTNNYLVLTEYTSVVKGSIGGIGYTADHFNLDYTKTSPSFLCKSNAFLIDYDRVVSLKSISGVLSEGLSNIVIQPGDKGLDSMRCLVSLTSKKAPSGFDKAFMIDIKGFSDEQIKSSKIELTLSTDPNMCTAVCVLDSEAGEYKVVKSVDHLSSLVFEPEEGKEYYISIYESGEPHLPIVKKGIGLIDYLLMVAIVIVFSATVVMLVKMKRE